MTEKIRLVRVATSGLIVGKPGGFMGPITSPYREGELNIQSMLLHKNLVFEVHPKTGEERKLTLESLATTESFLTEAAHVKPATVTKPQTKVAEAKVAETKPEVKAEPKEEKAPQKGNAGKNQQAERNTGSNRQVEEPTTKK